MRHDTDLDDLLTGLSDSEQAELKRIWALTGRTVPSVPDTDAAWRALNRRRSRGILSWRWAAAAAVVIAVGYAAWLATPHPTAYVVAAGETRSVTLPDGTTVDLNSGSELTVEPGFGETHRDLKLTGEAYFDVAADSSLPMRIRTHNATVQVVGTRFNLRAWPSDVTVSSTVMMEEGEVMFAGMQYPDAEVRLVGGWQSQVSAVAPAPAEPSNVDVDLVGAWRHNGLYLRNEPMAVFVDELRRRYGVDIAILDPAIANRRVDFALRGPLDLTGILRSLTATHGIGFREPEPGLIVLFVLERNGIRSPSLRP